MLTEKNLKGVLMKSLDLRARRLIGCFFLILAVVLDAFFYFIGGTHTFTIGLSSTIILVIFGILFLTGWPYPRK